jgi:hypothetical protein
MHSSKVAEIGDFIVYLPVVGKNFPPPPPVFGVQMDSVSEGGGLGKVVEAQITWVGGIFIDWSAVEPSEGDRNWQAFASKEQQLLNASENNLTPIVTVRFTPEWARKYPNYACGPMARAHFDEFADFMSDAVEKYSQPPYNARYWEIWNEPDVSRELVNPNSHFGCWGETDDPYYGGGYYADMLKVVYPRMKRANPDAQVMVGGLLLDCDPNDPPPLNPANPGGGKKDCKPAKFLQGILLNGGGRFFDGVSFHAYEYYGGALGSYSNVNWSSSWNTTGPVLVAKKNYLQSLLDASGVTDKFLINTESALLGDGRSGDPDFEQTKANYVAQSYAMAIAEGLRGNLWYSLLGWRNSNLLDANLDPLPAYDAFKFASQKLGSVVDAVEIDAGDVDDPSGLKGYKFDSVNGPIWIVWSMDGGVRQVTLKPGVPNAVYNVFGNPQSPTATISVGLEPLYLEW